MACLVVVEGPAAGTYFALGSHRLVNVGRDEECTFQIVDPLVSRHHLNVRAADDATHVASDCQSANGVFVNGARITAEVPLANGDEIKLGSTRLIYSSANYPDAQSAIIGVRRGRQWAAPTLVRP